MTWDRPGEVTRFVRPDGREEIRFGPEPRIFIADARLAAVQWQVREEESARLRLPLLAFPSRLMLGIDGKRFGVEQDLFQRGTRLEWWSHAPEGWEPLVEWAERVRAVFEVSLTEANGGAKR